VKFLAQRDRQPELMDQPGLNVDLHRHALAGLEKANSVCRVANIIWRAILNARMIRDRSLPIRVLDIAAGGGDVLLGIAKFAARDNVAIELRGCDISPAAVAFAQDAADKAGIPGAKFSRLNVLTDPLPEAYDIVMSTLFFHHLEESRTTDLLRRMANSARELVLVDDLNRTLAGYFYAWIGGRLLTRSRIVHTDGPLSVRSAYTIAEMSQIARAAGLSGVEFRHHWPERFLMTWKKAH
jgi:2-polyprenyl-3-methyl-5-hydroxy-6-metoxy-1,4-benzoquinol methylase